MLEEEKIPYYCLLEAIRKNQRIIEKEEIIKKDPGCCYQYARDVIRGRWPEGEKEILKDQITIDNIIQSPAIDTIISTTLQNNLSGTEDLLKVTGITSFFTGDLIRIDDEIMRINYVAFEGENTRKCTNWKAYSRKSTTMYDGFSASASVKSSF